jgi:peptidylprolyl isomerase
MAALDAKTALKAAESGGGMYCYLDLDVAGDRERLSRCAAFVDACDTRYGFASSDLLALGGSELKRIPGMFELDHEWGSKGPIATLPPPCGCRVVVELFPAASPLACENFYRLCMGREAGVGACGKPLAYRGSSVHRVQTGFVIQGGDFVMGNGSGGESVYGTKGGRFKDDRGGLALKHDSAGVLSMGNSGKHSNTSQFFLTLGAAPQCDGKHVVFGRVVSGLQVLRRVESLAGSVDGAPTAPVAVTACGAWQPGKLPGAGFWLDVPDADSHTGSTPRFVGRPRVGVAAPSPAVAERFAAAVRAAYGSARSGSSSSSSSSSSSGVAAGEGRGPVVSTVVVTADGDADGDEGGGAAEGSSSGSSDGNGGWKSLVRNHETALELLIVAPACAEAVEAVLGKKVGSDAGGDSESRGRVVISKPTPAAIAEHLSELSRWLGSPEHAAACAALGSSGWFLD